MRKRLLAFSLVLILALTFSFGCGKDNKVESPSAYTILLRHSSLENNSNFLRIRDADSRFWIEKPILNFFLVGQNYNLKYRGNTFDNGESFESLSVTNGTYFFYSCMEDADYYSAKLMQFVDGNEEVIVHCRKRAKDLEIKHTGKVVDGDFVINVSLTPSDGFLRQIMVCESHSSGISFVKFDRQLFTCEDWIATPSSMLWYCNDSDDKFFAKCEMKEGNSCEVDKQVPPIGYERVYDGCLNFRHSIVPNETFTFNIYSNGFSLESYDFINLAVFDSDRVLKNLGTTKIDEKEVGASSRLFSYRIERGE